MTVVPSINKFYYFGHEQRHKEPHYLPSNLQKKEIQNL